MGARYGCPKNAKNYRGMVYLTNNLCTQINSSMLSSDALSITLEIMFIDNRIANVIRQFLKGSYALNLLIFTLSTNSHLLKSYKSRELSTHAHFL